MLQNLTGNVVLQLDSLHGLIGAFRHRREWAIERLGRIHDHAGSLDIIHQRRVQSIAAKNRLGDRNLQMRLDSGRQRPENIRRIEHIDIFVKNKNVLGVIDG